MTERREVIPNPEINPADRNFEILEPYAFLRDFTNEANKAKHRVWTQTMLFEPDDVIDTVGEQLKASARRGIDSKLNVDYFSLLVTDGKFNSMPSVSPIKNWTRYRIKRGKREVLADLAINGVDVVLTNPPTTLQRILPSSGRNHIKMAFVDNIAWIGGLNLTDHDFKREDFMMRIEDPRIVQVLATQFLSVNEKKPEDNYAIQCTEDTTLLVDAGIKGSSLILDSTVASVMQAQKSAKLTSQYTPDGKMLSALAYAPEDIDIQVITSGFQEIDETMPKLFEVKNRLVAGVKKKRLTSIPYPNWMHAKVLLIDREMPDNAIAIMGTHNYSTGGVNFGTEEIALQSTNPRFIRNLSQYYDKIYARAINALKN